MEKQILARQYPLDRDNAATPLLQQLHGYGFVSMSDKAIEAGYGVPAVVTTDDGHHTHAQTLPVPTTAAVAAAPRRSPILTRLRTRWAFLPKRTKYTIYIAAAVVAILLAIGLGAGLGVKAHKDSGVTASGATHTGDLTYYDPGLGACGKTNTASDSIVAVSHVLFDAAQKGSNPNNNPLCGKKIRVSKDGKHVDVTVVDRCVGCAQWDLDVTDTVFAKLASISVGRTTMTWQYL